MNNPDENEKRCPFCNGKLTKNSTVQKYYYTCKCMKSGLEFGEKRRMNNRKGGKKPNYVIDN